MNKLIFFTIEGIRTFSRTLNWNLFSICFLAFFILFGSVIFQTRSIVSTYVNSVGSDVKIEAFLVDSIEEMELAELINELNVSSEYDSLKFVSKKEALEIFKNSFTNLDLPANMNPLPQSLILYPSTTLIESNQVYGNINKLTSNEYIEVVSFNKTLLDKLAGIQQITDIVTLIVLLVLSFFGIIVYYTSVFHSLNYKYEYLEVVDHLYAPKFWLSFPFFVESFIVATLSSVLFVVSYYLLNVYVVDVYLGNFNYWENIWEIVVIQVALTMFISILSTFLSVRSYK